MKLWRVAFFMCLLLVGMLLASLPGMALAQEGEEKIEEGVDITAKYPKLEITSGESAEFELEVKYLGDASGTPKVFDLEATAPKDWFVAISPKYPKEKKIASVELKQGFAGEGILVTVAPSFWLNPEPDEYTVTLEVSSGDLKGTYDMTVVVKAKYTLSLRPAGELFNTSSTAGKDNYFSVKITNTGSDAIDNIAFSSSKPKQWAVEFPAEKIDSLEAGASQTLDVNIKPPAKAIAGDYNITLRASGKQATADELDVRVTVETPTIWGWVGIIIIILVIAGLSFIFMRFSRR